MNMHLFYDRGHWYVTCWYGISPGYTFCIDEIIRRNEQAEFWHALGELEP